MKIRDRAVCLRFQRQVTFTNMLYSYCIYSKKGAFTATMEPEQEAKVFLSLSVGRPVSGPLNYRRATLLQQIFTK